MSGRTGSPIALGATPEQAAKLLAPPDAAPRGVYKVDTQYDFNVLDAVSYDASSRQISLLGHRDDRYAGAQIPYLQHLAALLENPSPKFSLNITPESQAQIDAFFKASLSPQERERVSTKLGVVLDTAGTVTTIGRYMLPAIGIYPVAGNRAPGYLGVETQLNKDGLTVATRVAPNSPAAQAGIVTGDFITFFYDGPIVRPTDRPILSPLDLARRVRYAGAGSTVDLIYQRGIQGTKKSVTLAADSADPWSGINRYDVVAALYRAAGDENAARVIHAFELIDEAPKNNPAFGVALTALFSALDMSGDVASVWTREQTGAGTSAAAVEFGRKLSRRIDEIFAFPGYPILAAYNGNLARTGKAGAAIEAAFAQFHVALKPKVEALLDDIFNRPEGVQIAPEIVEGIFHIRPQMTPQYLGVPPNSLLARAMFDGDYLIKRLVNRPDLKLHIPRYQTAFEFKRAHGELSETTSTYRTWISLAKMDFAQSSSSDTLQFRSVQMRFNTREVGKNGADLPEQRSGGYQELLTSLYDDLAHEYPTLNELREAEKLAAAAIWLRARAPDIHLAKDGTVAWRGPAKVPGLVFIYMFKRGETPRIDMLAEGGVNLAPFEQGLPPQHFPVDSSVVDLRGLAAGGALPAPPPTPPTGTPAEFRELAASGAPDAYRRDISALVGQQIPIPAPPFVAAISNVTIGKQSYQQITATIDQLSVGDAERDLAQRDQLEKGRNIALQLWVIERALEIIKADNPDWSALQSLRDVLADTNFPLKVLRDTNIQSLKDSTAVLNALRVTLAGQQLQTAGQLNAALSDPVLKLASAKPDASAAKKPWPCATNGALCTVAATSVTAKQVDGGWVCPPNLPNSAINPARYNQPDGHFCIAQDAIPCSGPTKSWACSAGQSCNGDGTDPSVALCR